MCNQLVQLNWNIHLGLPTAAAGMQSGSMASIRAVHGDCVTVMVSRDFLLSLTVTTAPGLLPQIDNM